jgi:hypothetical protein
VSREIDPRYAGRLRKCEWAVRPVSLAVCEAMVEAHHYAAGGANTGTYRHGLYEIAHPARIRGIAWWIPPTKDAAKATYPEDWHGVLSLSRLAIDPDVPKNAATFLLAASQRLIDRKRWPCLVTYADEWQDHDGLIYQLNGWTQAGRTKPESTWVLDGRMISRKAGPTTRTVAEMEALGAVCVGRFSRIKFVKAAKRRPGAVRRQMEMAI